MIFSNLRLRSTSIEVYYKWRFLTSPPLSVEKVWMHSLSPLGLTGKYSAENDASVLGCSRLRVSIQRPPSLVLRRTHRSAAAAPTDRSLASTVRRTASAARTDNGLASRRPHSITTNCCKSASEDNTVADRRPFTARCQINLADIMAVSICRPPSASQCSVSIHECFYH